MLNDDITNQCNLLNALNQITLMSNIDDFFFVGMADPNYFDSDIEN